MLVPKSPYEVGFALLIVLLNSFAVGMTFWGTFRRWLNETDETWVTSDHLVLGGNILQALALFGTFYFLSRSNSGMLTVGLGVSMVALLVIVLYMTQYFTIPGKDDGAQITILIILGIDLLVKTFSLLLGFGVCTVGEVSQIANTMYGGAKKALRFR